MHDTDDLAAGLGTSACIGSAASKKR